MEQSPQSSDPRRVEAYLDQVLAPLNRRLSAFHQQELRRELRTHLWERIGAYQELGMTEDAAVTEALKQFGGAEDFTRQWQREWTKHPPVSASTLRLWEAGKLALVPTLLGLTGAFLPYAALLAVLPYGKHGTLARLLIEPFGTVFFWSLAAFTFLLLPMLIGAKQGQRQPNPGTGMAAVLTTGVAAASLLYATVEEAAPFNMHTEGLCCVLLMLMVIWLPIASGSAALTGWWTQKQGKKKVLA